MKKVTILGSTGSIGKAALEIIRRFPERFKVVGLAAGHNVELLSRQIEEFNPQVVAASDAKSISDLKKRGAKGVLSGLAGVQEVAAYPEADFVLSAISGSAGLLPTMAAIRGGKTIGLANKETLVMAGPLVIEEVERNGARLIPVDSEHSAIFQCMHGHSREEIRRLILTASGGPFLDWGIECLSTVTPEDALNHPTWHMGKKITIDSATLINKGLEVIEAHYLFGFPIDCIDVVIHPQSIVHSMIECCDGSLFAHLSTPDMKGPIAYALSYPERLEGVLKPCSLFEIGILTFEKPDLGKFPSLNCAYEALKMGGTATAVLNAANEMAVEAFLKGRITFVQIPVIIEKVLNAHKTEPLDEIEIVQWADSWAREKFKELVERL